jgi:hypothetical protein
VVKWKEKTGDFWMSLMNEYSFARASICFVGMFIEELKWKIVMAYTMVQNCFSQT